LNGFSKIWPENTSSVKIWQKGRVLHICIFVSGWTLLTMRDVSENSFTEKKNYSITFSRKYCRLCNNVEKYCTGRQATDDSIIRHKRTACWVNKDTHTECVTIFTFPLQQWLLECTSLLHYTYVTSLVKLLQCFFGGVLFNVLFIVSQIVLIICCFPTYIVNTIKGDITLHIWHLFWNVTVRLNYWPYIWAKNLSHVCPSPSLNFCPGIFENETRLKTYQTWCSVRDPTFVG